MSGDGDRAAMTWALNRLDDVSALGASPLAALPAVTSHLQRNRLEDTPIQRGRVLAHLIRRAIDDRVRQPAGQGQQGDAVEWSILYLHVRERRTIGEIARILSIPERSVGRYYARAKDLLLDRLLALNPQISRSHLHCPLCGGPLDSPDITGPVSITCSLCGAKTDVRPGDGGSMTLTVQRSRDQ